MKGLIHPDQDGGVRKNGVMGFPGNTQQRKVAGVRYGRKYSETLTCLKNPFADSASEKSGGRLAARKTATCRTGEKRRANARALKSEIY